MKNKKAIMEGLLGKIIWIVLFALLLLGLGFLLVRLLT